MDFGCTIQKGDFDHTRLNSYADAVATRPDWLPYLKLDIFSMRDLYLTYAKEVWEEYQLNLNKFITLSSLAYYVFRCTLKTKIKLWSMPKKQNQSMYGEQIVLYSCNIFALYCYKYGKKAFTRC